jgi:DNA-binding CsgD family transcriptional regulator
MYGHASDLFRTGRRRKRVASSSARSQKRITPRELEVLALIAEGYSTKEIGRALWITEETVRTHVRRLLERLDARTRAQAVAIAYRDGLWATDDERAAG